MISSALVAVGLVLDTLPAQDPITPPGGFPTIAVKDELVTWSDRYRTRLDAYYPDPAKVAAPRPGWPTVLVIHGKGGKRSNRQVARRSRFLATRGYLSLAFDVRGDGDTVALNPGQPGGNSSRRILDVAEAFYLAERRFGALMDDGRLAVTGWSMGGGFSLDAASLSGRTIPNSSGGLVTTMPRISAVASDLQVLDKPTDYVPGEVLFQARAALRIFATNPNGSLATAIVAGNYAQLRRYFDADPVQARRQRLQRSDVALLISFSYGDTFHFSNQNVDGLQTLKPGTPRRYHLVTGGHGTPTNIAEDDHEEDLVGRWFDRFLKARNNGVDREPPWEAVVPPPTLAAWRNATTDLQHRLITSLAQSTPKTRFYLRPPSGTGRIGELTKSAPTRPEGPFTIRHRVRPGYTVVNFLRDRGRPTVVNRAVPVAQVQFDLPAAKVERELAGRVVLSFDVKTKIRNLQLSASLFDVPPSGPARWITTGFAGIRGVAPGTHRFRIEFEEIRRCRRRQPSLGLDAYHARHRPVRPGDGVVLRGQREGRWRRRPARRRMIGMSEICTAPQADLSIHE